MNCDLWVGIKHEQTNNTSETKLFHQPIGMLMWCNCDKYLNYWQNRKKNRSTFFSSLNKYVDGQTYCALFFYQTAFYHIIFMRWRLNCMLFDSKTWLTPSNFPIFSLFRYLSVSLFLIVLPIYSFNDEHTTFFSILFSSNAKNRMPTTPKASKLYSFTHRIPAQKPI